MVKYFDSFVLTNVSVSPGNNYTSGYVNPSLAYAMTFTCPGNTFLVYALVYWLGPLIGESSYLSLIPRKVLKIINVENHTVQTVQKWLLVFLRGVVKCVFFPGMTLALFLYLGNIPLLFSRNLLYTKKGRFRVPKGKTSEDKIS